ncbi:battenin isoform X3 [Poecile atricapillus]|uniref:battenin isoform X3 n=1 Tax=Poecile atricapillus TaxID=48891 RepID=UPI0027389072|nr:battenin isoform X3 [Poecile atricapillus]
MADEEPLLPAADDSAPPPPPPTPSWRIGAAFWILGLCNNLPYVVMLSAARDLLEPRPGEEPRNRSRHDCDPVGTGAVLLADVVPALGVKLLLTAAAPAGASPARQVSRGGRGPEPVGQRQRRGRGQRDPEQPGGSGLSYWSSGTGAAGLGGALGFWGLRALLPLPHALLPALALPPAMLLSFFFLLGPAPPPRPEPPLPPPDEGGGSRVGSWGVAKAALRLGAPLGLVYFAEYFVNQGLMELLYFPSSPLPHSAQYRTLQLLYQAGVFLSRSSLRCLRLRRLWPLALAQVLLAAFLLAAVAVNHLLPSLGVAAALAVGEGLVGEGPTGTPSST